MKRIICLLCIILSITLLFTGCGQTVITTTSEVFEEESIDGAGEGDSASQEFALNSNNISSQKSPTNNSSKNTDKNSSTSSTSNNTNTNDNADDPYNNYYNTDNEEADTQMEVTMPANTYLVRDYADSFKYCGRTTFDSIGYKFNGTDDSVEFSVDCSGTIALKFVSQNLNTSTGFGMYFTVFVDGERLEKRFHVNTNGTQTIVITEGLDNGNHVIRLYRQGECHYGGNVHLNSILTDGTIGAKPADKSYYIEFIGDSITTGYANLYGKLSFGDAPGDAPGYQDGTLTYEFALAQKLNVDFGVIAWQGIGMAKGFREHTMPQLYEYFPDTTLNTKFTFNRTPDMYVINLGTNDIWNGVSADTYIAEARAFITSLKNANPNAKVVLLGGMMVTDLNKAIPALIKGLGGESAGLYSYIVGNPCAGHPLDTEHIAYSEELLGFFKSIVG